MKTVQDIRHVLIADDDPDIRTFLSMNLEMSGFQVVAAEDGVQAGIMARRLAPQVIILDVMMPGLDGVSVLRDLKSDPVTQDIPVIMLSAKTSDTDVWAGWEAGASYYITKPFDVDHLIDFLGSLGTPEESTPAP